VVYSIFIRAGVSLSVLHGGKGAVCAKSCFAWGQGLAVGATAEDAIAARRREDIADGHTTRILRGEGGGQVIAPPSEAGDWRWHTTAMRQPGVWGE